MKKLGEYINGNCKVTIFDDGTKVRFTPDDEFLPVKPESMDLKITNKCGIEKAIPIRNAEGVITGFKKELHPTCAWCHEKSTPDGDHAKWENFKFIETLLPYTECALGGGDLFEYPDCEKLLDLLKENKIIANATFNQIHIELPGNVDLVKRLISEKKLYGVGISLISSKEAAERLAETLSDPIFSNAVVHVINGVHSVEVLKPLMDKGIKILILGYKTFGRGVAYGEIMDPIIKKNQQELKDKLPSLIPHFKAVSFDNLAINQLGVQDILSPEDWDSFYMGEEGQFTMYIDAVKGEYAVCSIAEERFPLKDDIEPMFKHIREITGNDVDSQKKKE